MLQKYLAPLRSRPRRVVVVGALLMLGVFIRNLVNAEIHRDVPIGLHPHRGPDHAVVLGLIFLCGLVLVITGVSWLRAERSTRRLL